MGVLASDFTNQGLSEKSFGNTSMCRLGYCQIFPPLPSSENEIRETPETENEGNLSQNIFI